MIKMKVVIRVTALSKRKLIFLMLTLKLGYFGYFEKFQNFSFFQNFHRHAFDYLPKYKTNDDFKIIANTSKMSSPSVLQEYLNGRTSNVAINDKKNTTLKGLNIKVCK